MSGPFVVGPAVERKIGLAAFSQMSLDATELYAAEWAKDKGLYTEVYSTIEELDSAVQEFAARLASYNPEALKALKQVLWQGTEHWDTLLVESAGISGTLVLSDFTRNAIRNLRINKRTSANLLLRWISYLFYINKSLQEEFSLQAFILTNLLILTNLGSTLFYYCFTTFCTSCLPP